MAEKIKAGRKEKQILQTVIDANKDLLTPKTILVIKTMPVLKARTKGAELNEGYEFEVNGAIPEIADGIAKMAKEMENNGFGENSGDYFVELIAQYYRKLK